MLTSQPDKQKLDRIHDAALGIQAICDLSQISPKECAALQNVFMAISEVAETIKELSYLTGTHR